MTIPHKLIVLWLLMLAGMILHFNYHVSYIFYGIDVKKTGADGTLPSTLILIRTLYYHLPILFVVLLMYMPKRWFALLMGVVSWLYALSHGFHLAGELRKTDIDHSQIILLIMVFATSVIAAIEHVKWIKGFRTEITEHQ